MYFVSFSQFFHCNRGTCVWFLSVEHLKFVMTLKYLKHRHQSGWLTSMVSAQWCLAQCVFTGFLIVISIIKASGQKKIVLNGLCPIFLVYFFVLEERNFIKENSGKPISGQDVQSTHDRELCKTIEVQSKLKSYRRTTSWLLPISSPKWQTKLHP